MAAAARAWRRSNEEAEYILAGLDKSRFTEVRYEDLCESPDVVLAEILGFIAVEPTAKSSDFRSVEQHVLGNDMRLDRTVEVRLDERWRDVLTPQDLRTFDLIAGRMNRKYGYE